MRFIATFVLSLCSAVPLAAADIDFDRDVAPILSRRCLECHRGDDAESELDLSIKKTAFAGGENGPAVVAGELATSLIWKRVSDGEMPPENPLPEKERTILKQWIESGAKWGSDPIDPFAVTSESRAGYDWWSLQPLNEVVVPDDAGDDWSRNAIDRLVSARLRAFNVEKQIESNPLTVSKIASRNQLVRRVFFDVTGLPPTAAELTVAEKKEIGELIDERLESPQFGQHWARHWLDVVRFGESHGFEYNQPRNHSWHYRNWVIAAFNDDMPYDAFVRQQIAGDVMSNQDPDAWVATGFLVAGPHNTTKPSSQKMRQTMRHDELEDIVGTIGQTFLGLTVNCARCHDHKFDPITQKEYYQLVASVIGIDHGERELPDERVTEAKRELGQVREKLKALRERLKPLVEKKEDGGKEKKEEASEAAIAELRDQISPLEQREKELGAIKGVRVYMAVSRSPQSVNRLKRGDVSTPAEPVTANGLRAINEELASFELTEKSSDGERRTRLANWVAGNQNPLLARVMVNRLWHYYFGQGLVRTPSDFGFNGDRPSHPQLLDYLAGELIRNEWRMKPIHRMILNSATYQQSSRGRSEATSLDAENRMLWRMSPRRLSAEQIRDSVLRLAGKLDNRLGGAGYRDVREYKYRGSHYYDLIQPSGDNAFRRTVYRFSPRGAKRTILDTFDCPDPSAKTPRRAVTTTPLQALSLMNSAFALQMSEVIAKRIQESEQPVRKLYRLAYGRDPGADEVSQADAFAKDNGYAALCRVVINSNEFLYVR